MRRVAAATLVTVVLMLTVVGSARAVDDPPGEATLAYSYMRDSSQDINYTLGWAISFAGYVKPWFALVGEANGNYERFIPAPVGPTLPYSVWLHTIAGGGRIAARPSPKMIVFGQMLAGWG